MCIRDRSCFSFFHQLVIRRTYYVKIDISQLVWGRLNSYEIDKVEDGHFGNCRGYDQLKESEKHKVRAVVAKYIKQVNKDESGDRQKEIEETVKEALNEFEKDNIENVSLTDKELSL